MGIKLLLALSLACAVVGCSSSHDRDCVLKLQYAMEMMEYHIPGYYGPQDEHMTGFRPALEESLKDWEKYKRECWVKRP